MHLTDLADACRKSGLKVVEISGWQTRGRPASTGGFNPRGVLCHHTGSQLNGRGGCNILLAGRPDLPAPLSQLSLDRQGVVYVVAAGRANHAGVTRPVGGWISAGDGNTQLLGIEAQNTGVEGWTAVQLDAYHRLCAALCDHYKWPRTRVLGHGETSTAGKWDPGARAGVMIDMAKFRKAVAAIGRGPSNVDVVKPKPVSKPDLIAQATVLTINEAAKSRLWQRATWKARAPHLANLINDSGADIVCVQEAGSMPNVKLMDALTKGYKRAPGARGPLYNRWRYLYFNPKTYRCLKSGLMALNKTNTKHAAWGLFQHIATGKTLFVCSVHISAGGASKDKARKAEATVLIAKTKTLNTTHAPVVYGGDFNSAGLVGDEVMAPAGFKDTLDTADDVTDEDLDSNPGWDLKAKRQLPNDGDGWHLDHIYAEGGIDARTWTLAPVPHGSDHNGVKCTLRF